MKHYRIKEIVKESNTVYIIQYIKTFLWIFNFWIKYNKIPYQTFEDSINEIKKIIDKSDYEGVKKRGYTVNYHYIDVFRLKGKPTSYIKSGTSPGGKNRSKIISNEEYNKMKNSDSNKFNKSKFVPKK